MKIGKTIFQWIRLPKNPEVERTITGTSVKTRLTAMGAKDIFISDNDYNIISTDKLMELVKLHRFAELRFVSGSRDCLPAGTRLLKPDGNTISIENIEIGGEIIGGEGKPVRILNKIHKPMLKCRGLKFGTASKPLVCSDSHKFLSSTKQGKKWSKKSADELNLYDEIEQLGKLNISDSSCKDYSWGYLAGLYLGDGWIDHNRMFVAGRGIKEKNKEWVLSYLGEKNCELLPRWIIIRNKDLVDEFRNLFGTGSYTKRFLKHNFSEECVRGILDGWKCDANERDNSLVYSTVNYDLALSLRVLHRILGIQVSIIKVDDHGGFGFNPIYRVGVRRIKNQKVFVHDILDEDYVDCWDISTTDGKIYLVEQDVVTFNCDDYSFSMAGLMKKLVPGICLGIVWADMLDYKGRVQYKHAFNFFIDEVQRVRYLEPQTNKVFTPTKRIKPYLFIL